MFSWKRSQVEGRSFVLQLHTSRIYFRSHFIDHSVSFDQTKTFQRPFPKLYTFNWSDHVSLFPSMKSLESPDPKENYFDWDTSFYTPRFSLIVSHKLFRRFYCLHFTFYFMAVKDSGREAARIMCWHETALKHIYTLQRFYSWFIKIG